MSDTTSKTNEKESKNDSKKKQSFFKGLKKEFKKISWPDKNQMVKETSSVIVVSVIMGVFIAVLDLVVKYGVDFLTQF